jgi:hypothetical protein
MIHVRNFESSLAVRAEGDGRTLAGVLLPWNVEARVVDRGRMVVETFERGALADATPGRIPLTAPHPKDSQQLPIGVPLSIEERDDAAWGEWHVSDTAIGNEVLELARDQVPLGLSVGFAEVPGGSRWSPDRQRVAGRGHCSTTSPSSGCRPSPGPGSWACAPRRTHAPPWPSSPWPTAVGKAVGPQVYRGMVQGRCRACKDKFIGPGDRCPKCKQALLDRKRRKPR